MLRRKFFKTSLALAALTTSLVGQSARAQMYQPVPQLRYEAMPPPPPGRPLVWRPGHWRWTGWQYIWIPGAYVPVGPRYRRWVHGHWENRRGVWVWVEPHWQ